MCNTAFVSCQWRKRGAAEPLARRQSAVDEQHSFRQQAEIHRHPRSHEHISSLYPLEARRPRRMTVQIAVGTLRCSRPHACHGCTIPVQQLLHARKGEAQLAEIDDVFASPRLSDAAWIAAPKPAHREDAMAARPVRAELRRLPSLLQQTDQQSIAFHKFECVAADAKPAPKPAAMICVQC